ncbi:glycoside hydrolase [Hymenopellis radicata]|nr:glycoside hydrolase [Hymenopellis radicata]
MSCRTGSYADSANFLSFLKSLRSALGWSKIISAAVAHQPWLGPSGTPLTNVSAYAAQMTYINIMNYDVNGSSSTPGPNAPLGIQCGTSHRPELNAVAALAQWSRAGMPPSKMLLGLALYGYVSRSSATKLSGSSAPDTNAARVRSPASMRGLDRPQDLSQWWGQQVAFGQLVKAGAVKKQGGVYVGANGFTSSWDDCTDTPFLFNVSKKTVVSYDDTHSLSDKADFVRNSGMGGCFTWSLDQDDGYTLHNSVRAALGK